MVDKSLLIKLLFFKKVVLDKPRLMQVGSSFYFILFIYFASVVTDKERNKMADYDSIHKLIK